MDNIFSFEGLVRVPGGLQGYKKVGVKAAEMSGHARRVTLLSLDDHLNKNIKKILNLNMNYRNLHWKQTDETK